MEKVVPFFNGCVSFVAFITTMALVIYMLITFITGTFDVALLMFDTVFLEPAQRQSILNSLYSEFLHNIAVLLILMKAYRILVEYMRFHHIDIKFMVEIGIVACILELLFNSSSYTEQMQMVLAAMSITFLGFYVFKYENIRQAMQDSQSDMTKVVGKVMAANEGRKVEMPIEAETVVSAPKRRVAVAKKTARKTTKKVAKTKS